MPDNKSTETIMGHPVHTAGDTAYITPKNEIVNIQELWAFLSVDQKDNTEGIIAMMSPTGVTPMIAADAARLAMLMPHVERLVQDTGIPARLVKFTTREDIRLIERKP